MMSGTAPVKATVTFASRSMVLVTPLCSKSIAASVTCTFTGSILGIALIAFTATATNSSVAYSTE